MGRRKWIRLGIIAAVAGAICVYLAVVDPSDAVYAPKCVFYHLTGLQCPGCGSQRAMHALLEGRIADAWHYNALMLLAIPPLSVMGFAAATKDKYPRLYQTMNSMHAVIIAAVAIVGWFLIRNFML